MKTNKEAALIKKLKHLWSTPEYSGTGALTFKAKLSLEKNLKVPLSTIYKALKGI